MESTAHSAVQVQAARIPTLDLAKLVIEAALQPIVEIHSGEVLGYEALMRGHDRLGYVSPIELLDHAHRAGTLVELERLVQHRALGRFRSLASDRSHLVFLNLDGRLIEHADAVVDGLLEALDGWGLSPALACLELSERTDNVRSPGFPRLLARLRRAGIRVALDDFGTGYAELQMLCDHGLDFIKIDRHFVSGIDELPRRQLFVSTLANLAHVLGVRVIAEGVETEAEYLACREAGCDLIQGHFVARPSTEPRELLSSYPAVGEVRHRHRRAQKTDELIVRGEMVALPAIRFGDDPEQLFDHFARHPNQSFFPVIDATGAPIGIVHERSLKSLIYSDFGRDLLRNKNLRPSFGKFVTPVPVADIRMSAERLLEVFAASNAGDALILTENLAYCGVLTSASLIKVINEKKLRIAQDLNPLTELPGNAAIQDLVAQAIGDGGRTRVFCYFDFDHFKPFNDAYGFTRGDQAILLFARLMRERLSGGGRFVGHIGGDDFFAAAFDESRAALEPLLRGLVADFAVEVRRLYAPEDLAAGALAGLDRDGNPKRYPLLTCSASVIELAPGRLDTGIESIGRSLAEVKQLAKRAGSGFVWRTL